MPKIVTLSGTSRPDNYTAKALGLLEGELAAIGMEVVALDGRELDLAFPGEPTTADAKKMQQAFRDADGIVLATPEYHGSFSAWLKLAIENIGFPSALKGKPVALLGVASGRIGAIKSLEQLRSVCAHTGAVVLPQVISLAGVRTLFNEQGECTDADTVKTLRTFAAAIREFQVHHICPERTLEDVVRDGAKGWSASV